MDIVEDEEQGASKCRRPCIMQQCKGRRREWHAQMSHVCLRRGLCACARRELEDVRFDAAELLEEDR